MKTYNCKVNVHFLWFYDMLVLQYFQAIPQGQLPSPEGPLSSLVQPAAVCAAMSVFRLHNMLAIKIKPQKIFLCNATDCDS